MAKLYMHRKGEKRIKPYKTPNSIVQARFFWALLFLSLCQTAIMLYAFWPFN